MFKDFLTFTRKIGLSAQLEVEIFMNELAEVLPKLALDEAGCTYAKSLVVQGYNHLPASWI